MPINNRDPAHPSSANNSVMTRDTASYNKSIMTNKSVYYHKSLDLSNVGMTLNGTDSNDKWLRQFHQTRIYVRDFNRMYHHAKIGNGLTSDRNLHIISANLPESVSYRIGSTWQAPLAFGNDASFNLAMQTIGSQINDGIRGGDRPTLSGVNRVSSLKVWAGSTPLQMSLQIPVIDDGYQVEDKRTGLYTNLAEALEFLGSLCLPSGIGDYGFYIPPPSPLDFSIEASNLSSDAQKLGLANNEYVKAGLDFLSKDWHLQTEMGHISVQLGGMLLIEDVIIESVQVTYPNTKGLIRHSYGRSIAPGSSGTDYLTPLLAVVTINLSTIENMTADNYSKMLWIKKDQSSGELGLTGSEVNTALSGATNLVNKGINAASEAGNYIWDKAKEYGSNAWDSAKSWFSNDTTGVATEVTTEYNSKGTAIGQAIMSQVPNTAATMTSTISTGSPTLSSSVLGTAVVQNVTGLNADKVGALASAGVK